MTDTAGPATGDGRAPEPIDAVTVILVRDGPAGGGGDLEVLLLERHGASSFAPGALVFPGGKLDPSDRQLAPGTWRCTDPTGWAERLGVRDPDDAVAMLVAAVRETFEEAGVLLAAHADGVSLEERPLPPGEVATIRERMAARDGAFDWRPWLADTGLVLDLDVLSMWSWWVTPVGLPQRFDTRFLLTSMPPGQVAAHDRVETTGMRWISPARALERHAAGQLHVIYPTRRTLEQLADHGRADAVLAAARAGQVDLRRIEPTVVRVDGQPMVRHPDGGPPAGV